MSLWSHDAVGSIPRPEGGRIPEEIEAMQTEIHELAERVDFLERMLSQVRDRAQVAPGRGQPGNLG